MAAGLSSSCQIKIEDVSGRRMLLVRVPKGSIFHVSKHLSVPTSSIRRAREFHLHSYCIIIPTS